MSTSSETSTDLVAVACVVEASLLLASEWSRVLIEYVYPLLKRLYEVHPSHQFRLAFVTYGAADTRQRPLLSKNYFAPLSQLTKELREEPSKLGIGQTNSGSGRGLSALEGFVAAIELFDILMANFNGNHSQTQSPQKDNRSLVSHLLHIAASPPDNAQRPQCNMLQHLDFVNWDSIPAELRKRKINLSLISLRKIPQFQELHSLVAGPGVQSPWFNVHSPHILLLAGFPAPQKTGTKRQTDAVPSDPSPDAKRQKVADPVSKATSASPALPPARIPQRPQQAASSSQVTQPPPAPVSAPNSTPAQSVQATPPVPTSTPATASPAPLPSSGQSFKDEVYEQVVAPTGFTFRQVMERLKVLDRDIQILELRIVEAQDTGQGAVLAGLQEDRKAKTKIKEQIKELLKQHYHKALLAKENPNAPAGTVGSALPSGSAEAGPSTPSHPPNAPSASSLPPTSPTVDERKPTAADSQVLTQFWQSRGGTVSTADGGTPQAGPSQTQSHPTVPSEVAAQMQKSKGIRPQSFGPSSQTSGTTSHEIGLNPNAINSQVIQPSNAPSWFGTLLGTFPKNGSQGTIDVQVHVIGVLTTQTPTDVRAEIRMESWPKNFTLNLCKEPFRDQAELSSWLKRHQFRTGLMKFACNPRIPDAPMNEQRFQALTKFMHDHRICACAGWPLPSGKSSYNIFFFAMGPGFLAGTVFPDGIPDLPGSGNVLDTQPPVEQAKPRPPSGLPLPQWLLARMQGLELAKQKQLLAQFVRSQHVDQLRRQQLQQTQQSHNTPGQSLNSLGMTVPQNPYTAVANIPAGLHANVNPPPNSGAYNTGGRTVNYEMLQSFMQRNAEGSPSQGMNPGGVN